MIGLRYELREDNADRSEDTDSEPAPGYRHDPERSVLRVSYLIAKTPDVHFWIFTDTINTSLKPRRGFGSFFNVFLV